MAMPIARVAAERIAMKLVTSTPTMPATESRSMIFKAMPATLPRKLPTVGSNFLSASTRRMPRIIVPIANQPMMRTTIARRSRGA